MINRGEVPEGYKKTKIGIIPEEWEVKKLGNIGSSTIGLTYSPKDVVHKEGTLVLRSSNIKNGKLSFQDNVYVKKNVPENLILKRGDILVCSRNGSRRLIGKSALITEDTNYTFGAFMSVFRSKYNEFLYQLFQTDMFQKQIEANLGATINQITSKDFSSFRFPFPKSCREQKKIVSILSTWDKAIELKEQLIEEKKEQKKGLMQRLLTGKVRLSGFDEEWKEVKLEEIVEKTKGKAVANDENGRYPVIGIEYFQSGIFENFSNDNTVMANEKDVLLLWDGANAGKAFTSISGIVGSTFVKLECKDVNNVYLQKHLELNESFIMSIREGSGIPHVPKDFLSFYKLNLPPRQEQKAIAKVLSTADKEIELLEEELEQLKLQKKGLMQLLLTGIIRVKC